MTRGEKLLISGNSFRFQTVSELECTFTFLPCFNFVLGFESVVLLCNEFTSDSGKFKKLILFFYDGSKKNIFTSRYRGPQPVPTSLKPFFLVLREIRTLILVSGVLYHPFSQWNVAPILYCFPAYQIGVE